MKKNWWTKFRVHLANYFWPHKAAPLQLIDWKKLLNDTELPQFNTLTDGGCSHLSFNGSSDIQIYLVTDKTVILPTVQQISFEWTIVARGQLVGVILGKSIYEQLMNTDHKDLLIKFNNEYGLTFEFVLEDVVFDNYAFSAGINDIVLEERFQFSFANMFTYSSSPVVNFD
jgi:hypothetical protein